MGRASVRKWMKRARAEVDRCAADGHPLATMPNADFLACTYHGGVMMSGLERVQRLAHIRPVALHMRLRERKRREFWRDFEALPRAEQLRRLDVMTARAERIKAVLCG